MKKFSIAVALVIVSVVTVVATEFKVKDPRDSRFVTTITYDHKDQFIDIESMNGIVLGFLSLDSSLDIQSNEIHSVQYYKDKVFSALSKEQQMVYGNHVCRLMEQGYGLIIVSFNTSKSFFVFHALEDGTYRGMIVVEID